MSIKKPKKFDKLLRLIKCNMTDLDYIVDEHTHYDEENNKYKTYFILHTYQFKVTTNKYFNKNDNNMILSINNNNNNQEGNEIIDNLNLKELIVKLKEKNLLLNYNKTLRIVIK